MLDRDRIVGATDLAALADELLGTRRGTSRSASWACPSPHHTQTGRTPPVSVFRSGGGEERWHSHGCGIGGSAIDLVMVAQVLTVAEAIEGLAGRAGIREPFVGDRRQPVAAARPARIPPVVGASVADPVGLALRRRVRRAAVAGAGPGRASVAHPGARIAHGGACSQPDRSGPRTARPDPPGRHAVVRAGCGAARLRDRAARLFPAPTDQPPPDRPRYRNVAGRLASNPRVGIYEPPEAVGRCVIVTEGVRRRRS